MLTVQQKQRTARRVWAQYLRGQSTTCGERAGESSEHPRASCWGELRRGREQVRGRERNPCLQVLAGGGVASTLISQRKRSSSPLRPQLLRHLGGRYLHDPGQSHSGADDTAAARAHWSWHTGSHSGRVCFGVVRQRVALSRPETTARAVGEAWELGAGQAEPDWGGCMSMEATAGPWAVYWCPGGRPEEKMRRRGAFTPQCFPTTITTQT